MASPTAPLLFTVTRQEARLVVSSSKATPHELKQLPEIDDKVFEFKLE
ncbi:hypothetical protein CsSME_00049456 [Camellia sinensis var. sinensis]